MVKSFAALAPQKHQQQLGKGRSFCVAHTTTIHPTTWPRFATGKRFLLTTCSYLHARVVAILETPYFCHLSLSLSSRRCCKQPGWGSGREGVKWTTPTRIPPSPSSSGDDPSSAVSPTMDNNGEDQGHVVAASSPRLHLREGAELNGVYLSPRETAGTLSSNFKLVRDGSAQKNKERERGTNGSNQNCWFQFLEEAMELSENLCFWVQITCKHCSELMIDSD